MKKSILLFASYLLSTATLMAIGYGEGKAKYFTPILPDQPAVYTKIYITATDNAAGIQSAIDSANAAGGGTVQLAAKTYLIDMPITMKSNVRLLGEGMGATILRRDSTFTTSDKYFVGATDGAISDVVIEKMTLDRGFSIQEVIDYHENVLLGIRIYSGNDYYNRRIRVSEVEAIGFTVGVLMSGTEHIIVENCDMHHNGGTYLHHNIYFRRIGVVRFSGNHIHDSIGGSGLKLAGGTSNVPNESRYFTIINNNIYDNERINLNIQGCSDMLIEGNILSAQSSSTDKMAGLFMRVYNDSTSERTDIINNIVTDNVENGFYVEGCSEFNIEGNACYNNGENYKIISSSDFNCDYNVEDITSIENELFSSDIPVEYALQQNYPNPFNPSTKIKYSVAKAGNIKIVIYNLLGQEIKTLLNDYKLTGKHNVVVDGSNLTSGVYFYSIKTGDFYQTKKMLLMK